MKVIETREIDGQKYDLVEAARELDHPCLENCVFSGHIDSCPGSGVTCIDVNPGLRFWREHKETV